MPSIRATEPRPEKVEKVSEIRDRLEQCSAVLLTEYRGLHVSEMAGLRSALRDAGGEYKVYKNTLVRFAAKDLGMEGVDALLTGPTAVAFVDGDVAQVAKVLRDFARANPALVVKGGVLSGSVLSASETAALADLPSRDVLLSRIAGAFAAPMQRMASLLQALPQSLAYGLQALIAAGGASGETQAEAAGGEAESAPDAEHASGQDAAQEEASPQGESDGAVEGATTEQPVVDGDAGES